MKFHHFCPPNEIPWLYLEKSTIAPSWIKFSDTHVHNVWLYYIIDNWWTIVLWSGSTNKGWCNRFRKQFRWVALKYFFGLHIKCLITLTILGQLSELGGKLLPLSTLATRMFKRQDLRAGLYPTSYRIAWTMLLFRNSTAVSFFLAAWELPSFTLCNHKRSRFRLTYCSSWLAADLC